MIDIIFIVIYVNVFSKTEMNIKTKNKYKKERVVESDFLKNMDYFTL